MTNSTKTLVMIYFIYVQHMNHRTQIMQECSEYDVMTNSVKFMPQMTSSLSEGVCVLYLIPTSLHLPDK